MIHRVAAEHSAKVTLYGLAPCCRITTGFQHLGREIVVQSRTATARTQAALRRRRRLMSLRRTRAPLYAQCPSDYTGSRSHHLLVPWRVDAIYGLSQESPAV